MQSLWDFDQSDDGRATLWVFGRRYDADGLVEHDVGPRLAGTEGLPVDQNGVDIGINPCSCDGYDLAVDVDTAFRDQYFTIAARGKACAGQHFL
jgi:hypothetical protein